MSALLRSASSRGETPSRSADTITGVPCSSVPLTITTSLPFNRWYRAKMSDGTPGPATCPRCRGPLAYGQATATKIFCGGGLSACSFALGRGAHDHTSAREAHRRRDRDREREQRDERHRHAAVLLRRGASRRSRVGRGFGPRLGDRWATCPSPTCPKGRGG